MRYESSLNPQHEGKQYIGILESAKVTGALQTWHLMIDKNYWGRLLRYNENRVFDPTAKNDSMAIPANFLEIILHLDKEMIPVHQNSSKL